MVSKPEGRVNYFQPRRSRFETAASHPIATALRAPPITLRLISKIRPSSRRQGQLTAKGTSLFPASKTF